MIAIAVKKTELISCNSFKGRRRGGGNKERKEGIGTKPKVRMLFIFLCYKWS